MLRDLIQSASRPWEISALIRLKLAQKSTTSPQSSVSDERPKNADRDFCYDTLNRVSRSFAAVIQQLPAELRDPVCVFYLVLRGLDTIEDDPDFPADRKQLLLRSFHEKNHDVRWRLNGVGDTPDYRNLLANYDKVAKTYQSLDPEFRQVISRICQQMGDGMALFTDQEIRTVEDYDLYCYYVAGLVGVGLSELFSSSGVESTDVASSPELSIAMGSFLQKTNIIRDYHEDLHSDRIFWPEEIWSQYAPSLDSFEKAPESQASLTCLNTMIADALRHAPNSLRYLERIDNREVFRFCAIPQAMAMATLARIYDNPAVFRSVVKIRKGLTAMIFTEVNDFKTLKRYFSYFAKSIMRRSNPLDPASGILNERLGELTAMCERVRASARA